MAPTKKAAPVANAKTNVDPLAAIAALNPALAAQIANAISGNVTDVTSQIALKVDSSLPIEQPCLIVCEVRKARITDSFTANEEGDAKEVTFEWETPTPQLIVLLADANSPRHKSHFFNLQGYLSYTEVEDMLAATKQRPEDAGITLGSKGYALITKADGSLDRIPSEAKTNDCLEIVSRFLTAVGLDGMTISDAVDNMQDAIDNETPLKLIVKFGFGKEYINSKGVSTKTIEAKKFVRFTADHNEDVFEEEDADTIDEFDPAQA